MTEATGDELLLDQLRAWLAEARSAAATADVNDDADESVEPQVGLYRLVEEFTALRHEIKLQTRGGRALEERLEASLAALGEATEQFRSARARSDSSPPEADKSFALALAELDEALDRGRDQWQKAAPRLMGDSGDARTALVEILDKTHASQSWWQRRLSSAYHERVRRRILDAPQSGASDKQELFAALMGGFALIQQRLARLLTSAGVARIRTVGRLVDPEQMVVIEVVEGTGPDGQVVDEVRRGYTWNDQLLRTAEVRAVRPRFENNETQHAD